MSEGQRGDPRGVVGVVRIAISGGLGLAVGLWLAAPPSPLATLRAPLVGPTATCRDAGDWTPDWGGGRGEDGRRTQLTFSRHGDRAVAEVLTDGLGDDSVEAVVDRYTLEWAADRERWRVVACERRVVACYRGSPPVCS